MKKTVSFLLLPLLLASILLSACSSPPPQTSQPDETSQQTVEVTDPPLLLITIEEAIVIDQDGILVRVKRLDFSNPKGPALIYEIENHSQEAISSFFYDVSVNGIMIQASFTSWEGPKESDPHENILPGQTAELDILFPTNNLERARIDLIQDIEFALYIMDAKTKINLIDAQGIQIKTDADPSYVQTFDEEGTLVHDSEDLEIIVRLAETFPQADQAPDPALPLLWIYMVNKTEEERVVLIEEMKIDGTAVFNGFQSFLGAHKREYAYLYLDRQVQQEHNFESINEVSIRFQIQSQDYTQGALYRTETVSFALDEGRP